MAELVAEITGKKTAAVEDIIASIRCSRIEGQVQKKHNYIGCDTCTGANLAFGGSFSCQHACLGLGECAEVCPFEAITMVDGFPVVNSDLCVGCGTCVRTCPKNIIEMIPMKARIWVPCSTKDPGKAVKQICEVGCISCSICVKKCPAEAVTLKDNIVQIDHKKCMEYGSECGEICVEKCPRNIFRYYQPGGTVEQQIQAAAA